MLRKILVVDDSALIHQMYALFFARYRGAHVLRAMDGAEALERLAQERAVDLVLLDINMPVMNGLELLARLQLEPAYREIPVIVVTSEGGEKDLERCLANGARGGLKKPFRTLELHKIVEEITGARPA